MMENGVLKKYGVPATGRLVGPAVGAPARLPPGKIVASVAHSVKLSCMAKINDIFLL